MSKVASVDFNRYLNVYHGASYFRRWHGLQDSGAHLLVHKSHHFDLLNWWLNADPVEVFVAYGVREHYERYGAFRETNCRSLPT